MILAGLKKMLVASVVIVGLSLSAAQANAGWWGGGWAYGAGWDGCCGVAYVPCCSTWRGCGCRHHRAWGCGCGYDCGLCCGFDPCCSPVSCCGTSITTWGTPVVGSCGCGTVMAPSAAPVEGMSAPTPAPAPTKATTPPAPPALSPEKPATPAGGAPTAPVLPDGGGIIPPVPSHSTYLEPSASQSGVLTVWVPNEAKVTINGLLTKSTGSKRNFVSYGLRPGYTYKYVVKAEIVREGKIVTEEQTVSLTAGDRGGVAFGFNIPSTEGLAATE